jgi:(E)-4-hydroxy-3-methylbut-2-enyl-diphosphate synthase
MLWAGIGDTIRVSLAADPVEEIKVGFDILKSLGLRHRGVNIIACPSCARQGFNVIKTVEALEERLAHISQPMSLSIIGCVVNGPGEALMTDLGFTGGGAGSGMIYMAGKPDHKQSNDGMIDHIVELVELRLPQARLDQVLDRFRRWRRAWARPPTVRRSCACPRSTPR